MHVDESKLRRMFRDRRYRLHEIRRNKHWWGRAQRATGGPTFHLAVSLTPSDWRFERKFAKSLRRAEREATSR